jgi:hypothetical protein
MERRNPKAVDSRRILVRPSDFAFETAITGGQGRRTRK